MTFHKVQEILSHINNQDALYKLSLGGILAILGYSLISNSVAAYGVRADKSLLTNQIINTVVPPLVLLVLIAVLVKRYNPHAY